MDRFGGRAGKRRQRSTSGSPNSRCYCNAASLDGPSLGVRSLLWTQMSAVQLPAFNAWALNVAGLAGLAAGRRGATALMGWPVIDLLCHAQLALFFRKDRNVPQPRVHYAHGVGRFHSGSPGTHPAFLSRFPSSLSRRICHRGGANSEWKAQNRLAPALKTGGMTQW